MARIHVAIIDDHTLVANGLRHLLESLTDYEVVGIAHSGNDGLHMLGSTTPDVVLLDLRLPDMSGVELIVQAPKLSSEADQPSASELHLRKRRRLNETPAHMSAAT